MSWSPATVSSSVPSTMRTPMCAKSGLIAINLDEGDELAWVKITDGHSDVVLATRQGMSIRFHEEDARSMGIRTARGVKAISLEAEDQVVGMVVLSADQTAWVTS